MNAAAPLIGLLRLAEGIPKTQDNFLALGELVKGLNNLVFQAERDDDD